ncbi:MAG TPA: penicillin acylase family protein [Candidatus Binatia bacterium]|jgi:hypothetical protein
MKPIPAGRPSRRAAFVCAALLPLVASSAFAAASIFREPAWGLPHIYGDTDLDLAYENGREISKDRLAQLILLARAGRGTLAQAFGLLDPSFVDSDIETRLSGYTSKEYQAMFAKLPPSAQAYLLRYCDGVNDTIEAALASPTGTAGDLRPIEVTVLSGLPGTNLSSDLFGNATNLSDQVDPYYKAPGGADPARPNGGYQFTPEMALAVGVLEVRNFGLNTFQEENRLSELLALQNAHGQATGEQLWHDYNFLVDPLAPSSVPDPQSPGYGGPLAQANDPKSAMLEARALADASTRWKGRDWEASAEEIHARAASREALLKKWSAWPKLGSYGWIISADRSQTGHPWLGGFPQTGIQTPSLMHYVENRSGEGISGNGMEFVGAPYVLIGHTDSVSYTTTTAQLRVIDSFFEQVIAENVDAARYNDQGTPAAMSKRTENIIQGGVPPTNVPKVFWRTHERGGNGGSRAVLDFVGDAEGTAESGSTTTLVDNQASFAPALVGGYVMITDGAGAGQVRLVSAASGTTLSVSSPFTTAPGAGSVYVAAGSGKNITAVAYDSGAWMEESTTAYAFSLFQKAHNVMEMRAAVRLIPSTHNFFAADNKTFNGVGTAASYGNIGYWSSGYSRIRQDASDPEMPLDGTGPNPLVVAEGTLSAATATTAADSVASFGSFAPDPVNHRYDNPGSVGHEYVISIVSGTGAKQSRRIVSSTANAVTVEYPWGAVPAAGDHYEIYEIVGMPEAVNPSQGYVANWNNKAAWSDLGDDFGREHRVTFILERLAADANWTRDKQRQLNKDVAGTDSRGKLGRQLVPRIREAVDAAGDGGNPAVDTVLAALEAHNGAPHFGRYFDDPVTATTTAGEPVFLDTLINNLATTIYGDEYAGALAVPTGERALALVIHAIDSADHTPANAYQQQYGGDYFNGSDWKVVVRDAFSTLASGGIPAPAARGQSHYDHPLAPLDSALSFTPTPFGNRGTWEQIVESGPTIKGEFMFPLGQSGTIRGSFSAIPPSLTVKSIDPNVTSLQPLWRDWRFLPMLHVSQDLASGSVDADGDGVADAFERYYFNSTAADDKANSDGDGATLLQEYLHGTDPTDADTDNDGLEDGFDGLDQDRQGSGFQSMKAEFRLNGTQDSFLLVGRFGTGPFVFDESVDTVLVSVRTINDAALVSATLPPGSLTADGLKYSLKDPAGVNGGISLFALKLGDSPEKPASLKLRTIHEDLPGVATSGVPVYQISVTLHHAADNSDRKILDARPWTASPRITRAQSTLPTGSVPVYH